MDETTEILRTGISRRKFSASLLAGTAAIAGVTFSQGALAAPTIKVTGESVDPLFTEPFVDIDEWRDTPVRHRYVHGGFRGTDLLFSFYFPPKEKYEGRFFHPVMHIAGEENAAPKGRLAGLDGDSIGFAADSGGYLIESNMGSKRMLGPGDIVGFRASAAAAKYSRVLAAQMYGPHRPYGYIYGGSGGAFKTMSCIENTTGVWDGAVPFIHGSPVALPNVFTVQAHALRVLDGKFDGIVDAVDAGGTGDMYAGLTTEQIGALREVTRMGFPPRAWFAHEQLAFSYAGVFASIIQPLFTEDPGYFQDFWTVPGYLGANPPASLQAARLQHRTKITGIVTTDQARAMDLPVGIAAGTRGTAPAGVRVAEMPQGRTQGAFLFPQTGAAQGERLMVIGTMQDILMLGFSGENIPKLEGMRPGDEILLDNSDYLATQTYHRHQNPPAEFYVWDQFRRPDGTSIYPQRKLFGGYDQVGPGNASQSGRFDCKMITVNCLMDEAAYPWQPDWYRQRVQQVRGPDYLDQYRLWYVDNAMHVNPSRYLVPTEGQVITDDAGPAHTRIVSYSGILQQALRDVAAWAEKGVAPPAETNYTVRAGQIDVAPAAADRKGVQPVVALTANGKQRAEVKVGETVDFVGTIEVPPGAGVVVQAEWDTDGTGTYPDGQTFQGDAAAQTLHKRHTFATPGTHFVTLRAASQRTRALGTPYGMARNLARVRVVVT